MEKKITLSKYNELKKVLGKSFNKMHNGDIFDAIDFEGKAQIYTIVTGKEINLDTMTVDEWSAGDYDEVVQEAVNFTLPLITKNTRTFLPADKKTK